nr:MAG TPA: hypothetical protein [Caudoviricetes sp.]
MNVASRNRHAELASCLIAGRFYCAYYQAAE